MAEGEKVDQGSHGASRHEGRSIEPNYFRPVGVDRGRRLRQAYRLAQEARFSMVSLNQIEAASCRNSERNCRKTGTAPDVDGTADSRRQERHELQRVGDVSRPQPRQVAGRDQIDATAPLLNQRLEGRQAIQCFT